METRIWVWTKVYKTETSIPSGSGRGVRQAKRTCPGLSAGKMPRTGSKVSK